MQFAQEIFVELVVSLTICLDAFYDLVEIAMFDVSGWMRQDRKCVQTLRHSISVKCNDRFF